MVNEIKYEYAFQRAIRNTETVRKQVLGYILVATFSGHGDCFADKKRQLMKFSSLRIQGCLMK